MTKTYELGEYFYMDGSSDPIGTVVNKGVSLRESGYVMDMSSTAAGTMAVVTAPSGGILTSNGAGGMNWASPPSFVGVPHPGSGGVPVLDSSGKLPMTYCDGTISTGPAGLTGSMIYSSAPNTLSLCGSSGKQLKVNLDTFEVTLPEGVKLDEVSELFWGRIREAGNTLAITNDSVKRKDREIVDLKAQHRQQMEKVETIHQAEMEQLQKKLEDALAEKSWLSKRTVFSLCPDISA